MTNDERLISLLQTMVKTKSYSGEEKDMADLCMKVMKDFGFDEVKVIKYGTVLGCVKGNRPGKTFLFDGHMDTVDVVDAEEWAFDPFGGEIVDGEICGRGACDMKCGDAVMLEAVGRFLAKHGRDFAGTIYVSCDVHEECFEGVACREVTKHVMPDYVVAAEPTGGYVRVGQLGRAEVIVETEGVACHSSSPEKGINAVKHMVKLLDEIFKIEPKEGDIGRGILELVDIISAPYPGASVVPSLCRATFDRRTLPEEKKEDVLGPIEAAIARVKEQIPDLKAKVYFSPGKAPCWTGETIEAERFFPGWRLDESNELVRSATGALEDAGLPPLVGAVQCCTNNSHYAGEMGIPSIIFGLADVEGAHVRNESVNVELVLRWCEVYEKLLERMMK